MPDMLSRESSGRKPRIDFHVHPSANALSRPWVAEWMRGNFPDPSGFEEYLRRYSDPGAFEELLAAEGVDHACILADLNPAATGGCTNEEVLAFCRGRSRLIPFCDVSPHQYGDLAEELRRKVVEEGFRGLKLYPTYHHYRLNEPRIYPLYGAAQELGIPVLIHTGSSVFKGSRMKYGDPLDLDDVAVDFPRLNLVMAHSGRGFWYDRAFFLARLHPNVYMEVSGLPPSRLLSYFPELDRITDKVIFGSDWPGIPMIRRNMEAIGALPLPPEGVENILGGNAARLLGL